MERWQKVAWGCLWSTVVFLGLVMATHNVDGILSNFIFGVSIAGTIISPVTSFILLIAHDK